MQNTESDRQADGSQFDSDFLAAFSFQHPQPLV